MIMLIYKRPQQGFTIVELLIVIVVIAVLAAISIVAYNGIQTRAKASAASTALTQAAKKLAIYEVDNSNSYPTNLASIGINDTGSISYQYSYNNSTIPATYCVTATATDISYKIAQSGPPTAGGCAGHGAGGSPAMTNLHPNPGAVSASSGFSTYNGSGGNVAPSSINSSAVWSASGSAFRVTWTTVGNPNSGDISVYANTSTQLVAGATYTIRARYIAGQSGNMNPPGLWASSGVFTMIARSTNSTTAMAAGAPVEFWLTFQADATALSSGIRLVMQPQGMVVGNYFEASEVVVYQGARQSSVGFVWGNSPNWVWNGTANSATSTGPTP